MSGTSSVELEELWRRINYAFPVLSEAVSSDCTSGDYEQIQSAIVSLGLSTRIRDLVLLALERYIRRTTAPSFWANFVVVGDDMSGFRRFHSAVSELYDSLAQFSGILNRLTVLNEACGDDKYIYGERNIIDSFKLLVRATLLSQLPLDYEVIVNQFYTVSFNAFDYETVSSDMSEEEIHCGGCQNDLSECCCTDIIRQFHETNARLIDLQILERLTGQVLTSFIHCRIEAHVLKTCKGIYDVPYIDTLENWLDTTVLSWLTRIYCGGSECPQPEDVEVGQAIAKFKRKLAYYLYDFYTRLRIDELFNIIIIEYPDSQPAVNDIKLCLDKTDLRGKLCSSLQVALETRLLHPGVNTHEILTAYIHTIRALRHLDPSGVLLETVTEPVKRYLQRREDTVRSVVSGLMEEGPGSELADELAKFPSEGTEGADSDLDPAWNTWMPDPVDADPNLRLSPKNRRTNDIISMLINIYGSKEMFVNEYRTLLADRLLAQSAINTEKEIENLERLKLRFGESQLHFCEVMLKDITDSKRINALMQQNQINDDGITKSFTSNAMILSAQFWPPFKDETLELPDEIKEQLEVYTKAFEALKGNRTLNWKPHLGNVTIDIEIGGKKLSDVTVPPIYATIIMHFQTKPEWSLDELHQVMKVPPTVLRRKMAYWQTNGLIAEKHPDFFALIDESDGSESRVKNGNQIQDMVCEEDETESAMASTHDQREGELQVFWSYIVGMLTNLDCLPLDRIHQMLKMFASQAPGTECSLQELSQFLDTKVRSHQLVLQGGMYKLPKN